MAPALVLAQRSIRHPETTPRSRRSWIRKLLLSATEDKTIMMTSEIPSVKAEIALLER
jgi:hypothetical protein